MTNPHPERKHPDAECENCPLVSTGVFVPTKQPDVAPEDGTRYAFVGEAPGYQEAMVGVPFIGPSGRLLDRVLEHHEIRRDRSLLTNACLCRPEDNATPDVRARRCCRPRLVKELEEFRPDRVLAMGVSAAQSLLSNTVPITTQRVGRPRQSPEGFSVVPTVHPAYCLRNGDGFPYLLTDVGKMYREMPEWTPPQYIVADDENTALAAINLIRNEPDAMWVDGKQVLVADIEYGIDKDNDFDHANRYQMLCIGVCYARKRVVVFGERVMKNELVIAALKDLFRKSLLCGQNFKSDCAGLYKYMGDLTTWFDTMLAHYCLDERPGNHKLEFMGQELLGCPPWKQEIDKYLGAGKNYALIPRPQLYKYNAYDDSVTWDLMEYFIPELERRNLRGLHDFLCRAGDQLKFLELNGIGFDYEYSCELTDEYMEILGDIRKRVDAAVQPVGDFDKFGGLNPNSPKQVKEFLEACNVKVSSTDKNTLELLMRKIPEESDLAGVIKLILKFRYNGKRHGTFVKGMRNRMYRGRVYTTYNLHGTTSGRLSSRNPNLQNVVRDPRIKRQFTVTKPGNIFVGADFSQAEGRVICYEAQDEDLRRIFLNPDRDIFDELGVGLYPTVPKLSKDQRVRVKAYFYGLAYGRTAYTIAQEYDLPTRQVEKEMTEFFNLIPNVRKWQQKVKEMVLNGEDLVTAFGRRRRFYLITRDNRDDVLNEALSYVPQSTASDITLSALVCVRPMLRGLGHLRLTIHDQLVAECAEEREEEVTDILRTTMLEEAAKYTTYVPFKVDVTTGKHWGEL